MNVAAQELADLNTAHQDLGEDIAKYKANTSIDPVDAAPAVTRAEEATPRPQADQVAAAATTPAPTRRPIG